MVSSLAGRDVGQVLQQARSTFRYVPASKVSREDLADSKPNPALMAYTKNAMVGEVEGEVVVVVVVLVLVLEVVVVGLLLLVLVVALMGEVI